MERINYFDFLKGIAIILVVMGHIAEKSMGITSSLFNNLYGSFHMPIFITISGFLCFKHSDFTISDLLNFIHKKFLRVILPFLSVGALYGYWNFNNPTDGMINKFQGLWFLPTLFYCMIVSYITLYFIKKISNNTYIIISSLAAIWIISVLIYMSYSPSIPYYLNYIRMFPYFIFGVILSHKKNWYDFILSNKIIFTLSIILYTLILTLSGKNILSFINFNIAGFFAIAILFQLCSNTSNHVLYQKIKEIGTYSIEIYLFHWFLLPSLPMIGKWLTHNNPINEMTINNNNLIILFIFSLAISIPIIISCIYIAQFIRKSSILAFLILGIPIKKINSHNK